jgi:hypothetical protein
VGRKKDLGAAPGWVLPAPDRHRRQPEGHPYAAGGAGPNPYLTGGQVANPYLDWGPLPTAYPSPPGPDPTDPLGAPTGPTTPQRGVPSPGRRLPSRPATPRSWLWIVGAHGGAGESSVADLDDRWTAAGHAWPVPVWPEQACACVLVARTNAHGLTAAQAALTQWAASDPAAGTTLLGLVLIADAPGRLPKPLRDLAAHVRGGAPRTWQLPWLEGWRLGVPEPLVQHRAVGRLVRDLSTLLSAGPDRATPDALSMDTAATVGAGQPKGQIP